MKHLKLHAIEIKKEQYKKHLERLSHIYNDDKEKKKILKESKSVDKFMAETHRLRQTTNKLRLRHKIQEEKLATSRDWSKVNCSFLPTSRKPFQLSPSLKNDKFKHQQRTIEKQNKDIFFRLIKVKPTIQPSKLQYQFNKTSRMPFLTRTNKTQMDFSSILNSSIIRPEQTKKITIRLHNHNQQVIKIRFSDDVKDFLKEDKIYFLQVKNQSGKFVDSACFSLKELLESEFCIYKKKDQEVDIIDVKELFHESKTIDKGCFYIDESKENNSQQIQNNLYFIHPNKKIIALGAKVDKKNLKIKAKRGILAQRNSTQASNDRNLPQIYT